MAAGTDNLNPIEGLMAEASRARKAGVFGRTSVDVEGLLAHRPAEPSWFLRHRHALVGLPVAACLMLVVFIGTHYSRRRSGPEFGPVTLSNSYEALTSQGALDRPAESPASCYTGPGRGPVLAECACADVDKDGDVDLRDLSALQLRGNLGP